MFFSCIMNRPVFSIPLDMIGSLNMRYLLSILMIAVIFTIATGFYVFQKQQSYLAPALVVNDRIISIPEFDEIYRNRSHRGEDRQQFIESLITKEMLIQEARKMKIDQDEDFRHSIQNFYEQSLTKILIERKADEFTYVPSRQEIDRFLELQVYQVEMTMLAISDQAGGGEKEYASRFRDLSTSMQVAVMSLAVAEVSAPVLLDEQEYTLRLDSLIRTPAEEDGTSMSAEQAGQIIALDHREQSLARWLYELRKETKVRVAESVRNEK